MLTASEVSDSATTMHGDLLTGDRMCVPVWLSGRALRQKRKRLWVRFPGNTHTNEKCIT